MSALHWAGRLYSLETLDTRFNNPSKAVPRSEIAVGASDNRRKVPNTLENGTARPSKWRTPEFGIYALVFALVVPLMFKSVIDLSSCE